MRLLVVNAGSSTVKLSVLDGEELVTSSTIEAPGGRVDDRSLRGLVDAFGPFQAVGHRVVHGGTEFTHPVVVDDGVVRRLEALTALAPLHQPGSLAGLAALRRLLPDVPAVACFDTAFHSTIPEAAATYAIPKVWREGFGARRYGFHGLSHAYISRRVAQLVPSRADRPTRLVSCHLGAGASLAAVNGGTCVATTMGFTPLEGLVMATRSGTVDPGLVLWLAQHGGLSPDEISDQLEHHSGLSALAGTGDMREVVAAEAAGDADAALALAVYLHQLTALIGSMVVALGGLDVLAFTGGVGEHTPSVRSRAAAALAFLGVYVDQDANTTAQRDCEVTGAGPVGQAPSRVFVIVAREDLEIARGVEQALGAS